MAVNLNRVVLTGNLTIDPELRDTGSTELCALRLACNTRRSNDAGEWIDKPNYFNVIVWGAQAGSCARYLAKGSPVAVDGRLEWREWDADDGGATKRQAVEIVADRVQFLATRTESESPERSAVGATDDIMF